MKQLTFEEFAWRCLWLECGQLSEHIHFLYARDKVRELTRRAKHEELWQGPFFERSEWAGMVRKWYADYQKTGDL